MGITIHAVIKEECAKFGVELSDKDVEYVLWEKTGYPCFWPDAAKTPEENLRAQVRDWAKGVAKKDKAR